MANPCLTFHVPNRLSTPLDEGMDSAVWDCTTVWYCSDRFIVVTVDHISSERTSKFALLRRKGATSFLTIKIGTESPVKGKSSFTYP